MNDEDFAIIIGVSYRGLPELKATLRDATKFYEWVTSPTGGNVPEENVKLLLSDDPQHALIDDGKPDREMIEAAFSQLGLLWDDVCLRIGRRLYFYFTGHGFGPSFDDVGMLLATATAKPRSRLKHNIGLHPYRSRFKDDAPFDEVIYILDCCRDYERVATIKPSPTRRTKPPCRDVDDFVVLAAPYNGQAFEGTSTDTKDRRGFLTKAVLEALTDRVTTDRRGCFTAATLTRYIKA